MSNVNRNIQNDRVTNSFSQKVCFLGLAFDIDPKI